jgi:hypothetical protein
VTIAGRARRARSALCSARGLYGMITDTTQGGVLCRWQLAVDVAGLPGRAGRSWRMAAVGRVEAFVEELAQASAASDVR